MKITGIQVFPGRNIHSHHPIMRVEVDLQDRGGKDSRDMVDFQHKLLNLLPGLKDHHCSRGKQGGFLERLQEGTMLGHILEHVLLELQALVGSPANYGRTTRLGGSRVEIVFEYTEEESARFLVVEGVKILNKLLLGQKVLLDPILKGGAELKDRFSPGPSTRAILEAAQKRGIPFFYLQKGSSLLQLGTGKYLKRVQAALTEDTPCLAVDMAKDKYLSKSILARAGFPVAPGRVVLKAKEAVTAGERLGYPVVIKPVQGNQGKGVTLGITSRQEVLRAFSLARAFDSRILIEKHIMGRQYRLLVVRGKMAAAAEKRPPFVVGDGVSTIKELLKKENQNPLRGKGHDRPLTRIEVDDIVKLTLKRSGLTLKSVPAPGQIVRLRDNANLSTGGVAEDVTAEVHPQTAAMCCNAVSLLGLDVAGVDLVTRHISSPLEGATGAIIEINAAPGIRMHHHPHKGRPRDVADSIVEGLFPRGKPCTVPLFSITGTNGKTTTTRLMAHILAQEGYRVGMATTDGIYRGEEMISPGDNTGPDSAQTLLMDREVDALVLETARGGILRRGLGYDLADCAVITNISDDHLGQDGLRSVEDLIYVKSLVAEAVAPKGTVVLNAADPSTSRVMPLIRGEVALFGPARALLMKKHLQDRGKAVFFNSKSLFWADGGRIKPLAPVAGIPLTFQGKAYHHIENAMAAAAACLSRGVPLPLVRRGLTTFKPDLRHNPGRGNLFKVEGKQVLLDYGHNPCAFEAVARLARQQSEGCLIGVIGVPGDRSDTLIVKAGEAAARYFDRLYIKEDRDLRGRPPGEVAELLRRGCLKGRRLSLSPKVILKEEEAFGEALRSAASGDMVVVFYEKLEPLLEVLQSCRADKEGEDSLKGGKRQVN